jgi:hypothetical protein
MRGRTDEPTPAIESQRDASISAQGKSSEPPRGSTTPWGPSTTTTNAPTGATLIGHGTHAHVAFECPVGARVQLRHLPQGIVHPRRARMDSPWALLPLSRWDVLSRKVAPCTDVVTRTPCPCADAPTNRHRQSSPNGTPRSQPRASHPSPARIDVALGPVKQTTNAPTGATLVDLTPQVALIDIQSVSAT